MAHKDAKMTRNTCPSSLLTPLWPTSPINLSTLGWVCSSLLCLPRKGYWRKHMRLILSTRSLVSPHPKTLNMPSVLSKIKQKNATSKLQIFIWLETIHALIFLARTKPISNQFSFSQACTSLAVYQPCRKVKYPLLKLQIWRRRLNLFVTKKTSNFDLL